MAARLACLLISVCAALFVGCVSQRASVSQSPFRPLFPDQTLTNWRVASWRDVSQPADEAGPAWRFREGVLIGGGQGTWLVSKGEYKDFALELDWRIEPGANAGVGLRFPPRGDPAEGGVEVQIVDGQAYYRGRPEPRQTTGSLHGLVSASPRAANPVGQWNHYRITARGPRVRVVLNGRKVVDANVRRRTPPGENGNPTALPRSPLPRTGHIGFQNLSGRVELRNIRIRRLHGARRLTSQ